MEFGVSGSKTHIETLPSTAAVLKQISEYGTSDCYLFKGGVISIKAQNDIAKALSDYVAKTDELVAYNNAEE